MNDSRVEFLVPRDSWWSWKFVRVAKHSVVTAALKMLLVSTFLKQKCKSWLGPGAEMFIRSSFVFLCLQMPKISPHVHARWDICPGLLSELETRREIWWGEKQVRKDYVKVEWTNRYPRSLLCAQNFSAVCSPQNAFYPCKNFWKGLLRKAIRDKLFSFSPLVRPYQILRTFAVHGKTASPNPPLRNGINYFFQFFTK